MPGAPDLPALLVDGGGEELGVATFVRRVVGVGGFEGGDGVVEGVEAGAGSLTFSSLKLSTIGAGAAEVAGGDEDAGGGCCTTAFCFGGVIGGVAGVVVAGGLGFGADGLGLGAGELPGLDDEPPEQRPLVSGLGKTRPCPGELEQVLPSQRAPLLTGRSVGGERMMV